MEPYSVIFQLLFGRHDSDGHISSFNRVRGATKAPKFKLDPFCYVIIGKKVRKFNNMVEKQGLMSILKPHAVIAILVSVSKTTVGLLQVCTYFC